MKWLLFELFSLIIIVFNLMVVGFDNWTTSVFLGILKVETLNLIFCGLVLEKLLFCKVRLGKTVSFVSLVLILVIEFLEANILLFFIKLCVSSSLLILFDSFVFIFTTGFSFISVKLTKNSYHYSLGFCVQL